MAPSDPLPARPDQREARPLRRSLVVLAALLVVMSTACSRENDAADRPAADRPAAAPSADAPEPTVTPRPVTPEPSPTCSLLPGGEVSAVGSGFVAELNIMSGLPNPAWRLTRAEGAELRRLVGSNRDELDLDGPDELGGYGVTAEGPAADFLDGLGLPPRFWVLGEGKVAQFLGGTLPCSSPTNGSAGSHTDCQVLEFEGRTYGLTAPPLGSGVGVGRILGNGRTGECDGNPSAEVTVYSVNEEDPEDSVTVSDGEVVSLYTR